jgi:YesN/AraC family two-component response regulator
MKILIIEDEWIIAYDLKLILKGLGYNVVGTADNGKDALEYTKKMKPDIILVDIKLKGRMSGIEAAHHIFREYRIPVIYVTAFLDSETMQQAMLTHPIAYLNKPFTEPELEDALIKVSGKSTF